MLLSCGTGGDSFRLEGRFRNLNSGEFYIYSPDGGLSGIDTVRIQGGRFAYQVTCQRPSILVMVFPNFSEQPVFAEPSGSVEIKADASHMKEMEVTGTDDNKLMNQFRKNTAHMSPPETKKYAETMIEDHPESAVAVWLVRKYFINVANPDYKKAHKLLSFIVAKQPDNNFAVMLRQRMGVLAKTSKGSSLPSFKAKTIDGKAVSAANLNGSVGVISVLASWYYDSEDIQRLLRSYQRKSGGKLKLLTLSVDATPKALQSVIQRDTINWPVVCDGRMFDSPVMQMLGLTDLNDNILLVNGRIEARSLTRNEMDERLKNLLIK